MIICNRGIWDSSSENCLIRPSNESRSSTRIWPVSWLMIHATEHKSAAPLTLTDAASLWHLQNSEMHAFLYLKDVTGSILFWVIFMMPGALSTRQGSRSGQICGVCSGEHTECGTSRYSGIMQYARVPDHLLTLLWKSLTSRRPIFEPLFKNPQLGLLGGPVAKTLCSQCRGPGFNPWSGN